MKHFIVLASALIMGVAPFSAQSKQRCLPKKLPDGRIVQDCRMVPHELDAAPIRPGPDPSNPWEGATPVSQGPQSSPSTPDWQPPNPVGNWPPPTPLGWTCYTPYGACGMSTPGNPGSSCWCGSMYGPVTGSIGQ
jgi:hypothetical protein